MPSASFASGQFYKQIPVRGIRYWWKKESAKKVGTRNEIAYPVDCHLGMVGELERDP